MLSLQTSAYDIHPITVPVEGDLKTVNFYLILLDNQLILFDAGWNETCIGILFSRHFERTVLRRLTFHLLY